MAIVHRTVSRFDSGLLMTDSPINPRADVSPTCRGSTGLRHNGWNPAPLVPPSRVASLSDSLAHSLDREPNGVDIHGWNPEQSAQPTNSRTCGVAHALHRFFVPRSCPPRPWRGLPDRLARRRRWSSHSILSSPSRTVGWVRRGLRLRGRGLGLFLASPACAGAEGASRPTPTGFGSSPYVRPCPEGRIAPRGGSFASASGFGPRGRPGLVLLGCRSRGSPSYGSRCASRFADDRSAEGRRSSLGGRSNGLRPVCPALLDHTRRPIRIRARRFTNVPFSPFGGSRP